MRGLCDAAPPSILDNAPGIAPNPDDTAGRHTVVTGKIRPASVLDSGFTQCSAVGRRQPNRGLDVVVPQCDQFGHDPRSALRAAGPEITTVGGLGDFRALAHSA